MLKAYEYQVVSFNESGNDNFSQVIVFEENRQAADKLVQAYAGENDLKVISSPKEIEIKKGLLL